MFDLKFRKRERRARFGRAFSFPARLTLVVYETSSLRFLQRLDRDENRFARKDARGKEFYFRDDGGSLPELPREILRRREVDTD